MNRGALYQTIGMRCFYLTLPLMFWLFGPVFFLVASLFMVSLLISLDIAIA